MDDTTIAILTTLVTIFLGIIGLIIYFIPSFVAFKRKTASRWPIFLVNFFFGWTLLVWIVTLIWACEGRKENSL